MFVFFNLALGSCTIPDKDHNHTKSKVGSLVVWSRKIKRAKNTTSNNKFDQQVRLFSARMLLIREPTPSLTVQSGSIRVNVLRDFAYFIYANDHSKIFFVSLSAITSNLKMASR